MSARLETSITAVTVYPSGARVTRCGVAHLAPGQQRVLVESLPLELAPESVRVSGRGDAVILGVDVVDKPHPRPPETGIAELVASLDAKRAELSELDDADRVEASAIGLLDTLSTRAGKAFAAALAAGKSSTARVAELIEEVAGQHRAVLASRRELAARRRQVQDEHDALERRLDQRHAQRDPDRKAVLIDLDVEADGDVEIELSYVVSEATWTSSYDVRLRGDALTLTWYGLVSQHSGEDWPECDLRLSTARPASTVTVPELDPWYLDRLQRNIFADVAGGGMEMAAPAAPSAVVGSAPKPKKAMAVAEASAEHGAAATTYQPARPVAVPSDGTAHRTTVTTAELDATLDHLSAPLRGEQAYLRATAINTSGHAMRPGTASVFHETEFVGTTALRPWAPGEELELNLGIDDRVRIERKLVRRHASKAVLGGTRRHEVEFRITVGNYGPRTARVNVLDQIPVSRDEGIVVRDVRYTPEPAERTDLGELTWKLDVETGGTVEINLSFRVDLAKGVEMFGWRE